MLTDEHQTAKREAGGLQADVPAIITRVGLDDWSSVRHVHMLSFSRLIGPSLSDGEAAVETYKAVVAAPEHTEALQAANLYVAWVDGYMTGTCGWLPVGDRGTAARLTAVYVDPTFTRLGIGRRLVQAAEVQAYTAGFSMLTARAPSNSVAFFEALGFEFTSSGVHVIEAGLSVPVAFMRKDCAALQSAPPKPRLKQLPSPKRT